VALLKAALAPGILTHVAMPDYAHLDFQVGADAPDVAYPLAVRLAARAAGSSATAPGPSGGSKSRGGGAGGVDSVAPAA
jgi:hypothetical protein